MSGNPQRGSADAKVVDKMERDLANARRDAAKWRRRWTLLRAGLAKLLEDDKQEERQEAEQEEREERFG